jgi:ribosomal protein S18 acetylase RimI-like enzyme
MAERGHRSASTVTLVSTGPDGWRRWRALRRAALAEAPDAFSSTLAEWTGAGDTEARWRDRLTAVPLNVMASIGRRPVGMVSAMAPADDEVELISMWVAPHGRGRGIGDALIEAVVRWAAEQGASRVALAVREHNGPAIALYRRNGFADDGPSHWDPASERRMVRALPTGADGSA